MKQAALGWCWGSCPQACRRQQQRLPQGLSLVGQGLLKRCHWAGLGGRSRAAYAEADGELQAAVRPKGMGWSGDGPGTMGHPRLWLKGQIQPWERGPSGLRTNQGKAPNPGVRQSSQGQLGALMADTEFPESHHRLRESKEQQPTPPRHRETAPTDNNFKNPAPRESVCYVPVINQNVLVTHIVSPKDYLQMQASPLRMSQLTPPEELHTVAYVFTNGGLQMRSDEVNPVAKGHRSKKKHSRKSKRHSSSKRRKSMSLWLDKQEDASVTHNVHEEKIKNGQPAHNNVIATVPTVLINMAAAGISSMSTRDQYAAVTHNIHEEKINNSQPATDNILSTAPPWLGAMAAAGISSMGMRDLYAAVTHNVHEERINNSQPATNNILSTAPPWLGAMAAAGISSMSMRDLYSTITHNIRGERMENGQPQPDNVLSTGLTGLINMAATPIPATSARDLCMSTYKLCCPTWFSYAYIVP
ncbi:hypothetical protein H8959_000617 [Pygathrix nigripes]